MRERTNIRKERLCRDLRREGSWTGYEAGKGEDGTKKNVMDRNVRSQVEEGGNKEHSEN